MLRITFAVGLMLLSSCADEGAVASSLKQPVSAAHYDHDAGAEPDLDAGEAVTEQLTLSVANVDDFLYVTVNGVRRRVFPVRQDETLDVSAWFVRGPNRVRLQVINDGGPGAYDVQLRNGDRLLIDEHCDARSCAVDADAIGIVFDHTYTVDVAEVTPATWLQIEGSAGAHVYLDDAYTGLRAPAALSLPRGRYKIGLGVGEGVPGAYEGQFYEEMVELSGPARTVAPERRAPLPANVTRVAILPIRRTYHGGTRKTDVGVLSQRDIDVLHGQALATRNAWVEPFSYGLTTWDLSVLPVVEDTPLYRQAPGEEAPDTGRLLREAGLTALEQRFDSIVYLYSQNTETGDEVDNPPCCFWGIGQQVIFSNSTLRGDVSAEAPNVYLFHEMLHDYESFNSWELGFYNGVSGLHGSQWHGYHIGANGEPDFIQFYRLFMRNQVAELRSMHPDIDWTEPPPSTADLWIGVFDTMRHGMRW